MVVVVHDDVIVVAITVACLCVVEAIVIGDDAYENFNNFVGDVVLSLYFLGVIHNKRPGCLQTRSSCKFRW